MIVLQAPECTAAQHVACAGLDSEPEGEWYCAVHRNKPSVKRRRSASVRSSAEPQLAPSQGWHFLSCSMLESFSALQLQGGE